MTTASTSPLIMDEPLECGKATICIVNYKTLELTRLCLRSIRKFTRYPYEVLVIDNGSADESLDYLRSLSWIRLIERNGANDPSGGDAHGAALDMGLAHCRTEFFVSMHSDTFVHRENWLRDLVACCDEDTACVGSGKIELTPLWRQHLQRATDYRKALSKLLRRPDETRRYDYYNRTICCLYRTQVLRRERLSFLLGRDRGFTAGKQLYFELLRRGYGTVELSPLHMSRYIHHLAHATPPVVVYDVQRQRRTERKREKRFQRIMASSVIQRVLSDHSLDKELPDAPPTDSATLANRRRASVSVSRSRIRVAVLYKGYGGAVTSVDDLIVNLDPERFEIVFIYLTSGGPSPNHHEQAGYPVYRLSRIGRLNGFRPHILWRLIRTLHRERIDLVHSHTHKATFYAVLAKWALPRLKLIAHVHGLKRTRSLRRRILNYLLFNRVDRFLTVAQAVARDLQETNWGIRPEKVAVLDNSIDYEKFANVKTTAAQAREKLGLPADVFLYGAVGRLVPTKGIEYLFDAFKTVHGRLAKARLVLIGDGRCRPEYEQLAERQGLQGSVHFAGFRSEIETLLPALDVFVMSSVAEGMPRGLLEAMAAGLPSVATRVGGVPEVLETEDIGLLAAPRDGGDLADKMLTLGLCDEPRRRQMGLNARQRVAHVYSHAIMQERLREVYEAACRS